MVLTKALLIKLLIQRMPHLKKNDVIELVEFFFEQIRLSLEHGEEVKLPRFGKFIIRKKRERPGRNPKTGEIIPIKARKVVLFYPGPKLKTHLQHKVEVDIEQ